MIIRAMLRRDIPLGLALCRENGWNQTASDWEQLLALGGEGCIVAEVEGAVVGTLTTVRYDRRFAWIGMVLVERSMRGRGIATALMNHALEALRDVPARLDATPAGQPVYGRLGFVEESRFCRMARGTTPVGSGELRPPRWSRPMTTADFDAVVALDREVFGADRSALLGWALRTAPDLAWIVGDVSCVRGYCFGRAGHRWPQIGPIMADSLDVGIDLVSAAGAALGGGSLVVDASSGVPGWIACLASVGFAEQRPFIRMRRGVAPEPGGQRLGALAIFGPEWG